MEASLLNKGDKGLVATSSANIGKDKLQNVTKHKRNVQVAQVEFEHDSDERERPSAPLHTRKLYHCDCSRNDKDAQDSRERPTL